MAEYEGPEYPEDTTDYLQGAPPEVIREQQIVAQRREQDRVIASLEVKPANEETMKSPDELSEAVAAKVAEQTQFELKTLAIQTVTLAEQFESFDDMLDQAKKLYNWLVQEGTQEPQDGPEEPDPA